MPSFFDLFDFASNLIAQFGYFGIFVGTFLEAIFPPIPSEVIMGFAGFLVYEGKFFAPFVILAALLGNFCSASLIWFLGRRFGRDFIIRWGKLVSVSASDIEKGEKLFEKFGYWVVFACQILPLARTIVAFPAGVLKTKYRNFILANSLGAAIWLSFLCYLGYMLGSQWTDLEKWIKPYERIVIVLLFIFFVLVAYQFGKNKFQEFQNAKNAKNNTENIEKNLENPEKSKNLAKSEANMTSLESMEQNLEQKTEPTTIQNLATVSVENFTNPHKSSKN